MNNWRESYIKTMAMMYILWGNLTLAGRDGIYRFRKEGDSLFLARNDEEAGIVLFPYHIEYRPSQEMWEEKNQPG